MYFCGSVSSVESLFARAKVTKTKAWSLTSTGYTLGKVTRGEFVRMTSKHLEKCVGVKARLSSWRIEQVLFRWPKLGSDLSRTSTFKSPSRIISEPSIPFSASSRSDHS